MKKDEEEGKKEESHWSFTYSLQCLRCFLVCFFLSILLIAHYTLQIVAVQHMPAASHTGKVVRERKEKSRKEKRK